jgi:hypothetical protein
MGQEFLGILVLSRGSKRLGLIMSEHWRLSTKLWRRVKKAEIGFYDSNLHRLRVIPLTPRRRKKLQNLHHYPDTTGCAELRVTRVACARQAPSIDRPTISSRHTQSSRRARRLFGTPEIPVIASCDRRGKPPKDFCPKLRGRHRRRKRGHSRPCDKVRDILERRRGDRELQVVRCE